MFKKKKEMDRIEVLNLLSEGKISAQEASKILDKIDSGDATVSVDEQRQEVFVQEKKDYNKKMFRVIVDSSDGDKIRVNIPIALAKGAIKMSKGSNVNIGGVNFDEFGIDFEQIIQMIDEELQGEIVSVDSADGDIIKIIID